MKAGRDGVSNGLDGVDAKILNLLHVDGRMTNTEAARRLGLAEATVRKRVARMLENRVMQFQAWVDPLKVGYDIYAIIEIQVSPLHIEAVAERLAKFPEVAFLGVCTGAFDIFAAAVFHANADMYDFLTRRLGKVPGIIRTFTSSMIRLIKREYAFPIPAQSVQDGGAVIDGSRRRAPGGVRRRRTAGDERRGRGSATARRGGA